MSNDTLNTTDNTQTEARRTAALVGTGDMVRPPSSFERWCEFVFVLWLAICSVGETGGYYIAIGIFALWFRMHGKNHVLGSQPNTSVTQ